MKICIVSSAASVHVQKWLRVLHERGHEVHVITPELASFEGVVLPPERVHQYRRGGGGRGQFAEARWVADRARELAADITHLHSLFFVHPLFFAFWNALGGRIRNLCVSVWGSDIVPAAPEKELGLRDGLSK
nr:glycosyltransferase [Elusimicrobiota bacterium]